MQRRKFISLGAMAGLMALAPQLQAIDFRETKPEVWTAHTVDEAIENLYGKISPIQEGITLGAPTVAASGDSIPVSIQSDVSAKSLAVFQDANPESAVIVYTLNKNSVIDYTLKIKMKEGLGEITALLEGDDGQFYMARKSLKVTKGGCEGG